MVSGGYCRRGIYDDEDLLKLFAASTKRVTEIGLIIT